MLTSDHWSVTQPDAYLNVVRVDDDGRPLWQHQTVGAGVAFVSDMAVSPDGHVVVVGRFAKKDDQDERHAVQLSDSCQLEVATDTSRQ